MTMHRGKKADIVRWMEDVSLPTVKRVEVLLLA